MKIRVCRGKSCSDRFSQYIINRLKSDVEKFDLKNIEIEEVPCMGFCKDGVAVKVDDSLILKSNPIKISELIFNNLKKKNNE